MNEYSYDSIAPQFNKDRSAAKVNKYVEKFAGILIPGGKILDIGCGSGLPNALYLCDKGFKLTGIDMSAKLLELAEKNVTTARFIKEDFLKFDTREKFDGIIAWDSLFHLGINEHEGAFKKIHSMLNVDGYFLFTHGGKRGEIEGEMFGHNFNYSSLGPQKTRQILEDLGFKILEWDIDPQGNGYMIGLCLKYK